ncbi:amidohydrolase [Priestia aryabhattai]|uniref:amidohydrolase n=1 Tax=Priestia aryabhattai TaxID=412384 RepID=UPI00203CBF21|nr:amidohydrolase [Priestia aryabhattai]MCM3771742.1 amidohydrolase [Priestia aryabhattai]
MNFSKNVIQQKEAIFQTYKELHDLAEPSWHEKKTSKYVAQFLSQSGLEVQTFNDHYGLTAEIAGQTKQIIAIRADMDALLQEVDGVERANHSCGHDAHSTMVLYAAKMLASSKTPPLHTIRFIFQPAEETAKGALQMIKDGALDDVSLLFGIHLRPHTEVPGGKAAPAILHGSALTIEGQIKGVQAHAARPHEGKNPIESVSLLLQLLKNIRLTSEAAFSVQMTQVKAGASSSNVSPETASFTLDLRAPANELMDELKSQVTAVMKHVSELNDTPIVWKESGFSPAAQPDDYAVTLVEKAIVDVLGPEALTKPCVSVGAEDFHFYTWTFSHIKATMLGLGCDLKPGLHHPHMTFQKEALISGTQILLHALSQAAYTLEKEVKK